MSTPLTNSSRSGRRARTWAAAVLTTGALVATSALTDAAAADGSADLATAQQSSQPRAVGNHSVSKAVAGRPAGRANALAAIAADAAPAPASCVNVGVAPGSSPSGYLPLSAFGITPIPGVGDDTLTNFTVPAFDFNGITYTRLGVSSNGYVQVGGGTSTTFVNQAFPDTTDPDGVLAPFWTDLNINNAGAIRVGTLTDGVDDWMVFDWEGIAEFSDASKVHSFQVWIGITGDTNPAEDISYTYGTQNGNGDGGFLTVGAENNTGTAGATSYVDGSGTLPINGTQLRVTSGGGRPIADFSATPTSGDETLIGFDASASRDDGSVATYDWDFGDGTSGTGATTDHRYAPGSYTAALTVTDNDGGTCTATRQIVASGGFSVDDVSVNEAAGTATFTVSRQGGAAATVDATTTPGSATTPTDFTSAPQTLVFAAGELSKTYDVTIAQDTVDEPTETYSVLLSNATAGGIVDGTGLGRILDDDPAVRISVNDNNVTEGDSGTRNLTFTVRLNKASEKTVRVRVQTADGSARAPGDYVTKTTTLTFAPGQTVRTVAIAVKGDRVREPNETFFVLLDRAVNSTLADPSGTGGIINND